MRTRMYIVLNIISEILFKYDFFSIFVMFCLIFILLRAVDAKASQTVKVKSFREK